MTSDTVPVIHDLSEIYSEDNSARYERLKFEFLMSFGSEPDFFARAPGRVNLIGEHTDYSGYPVLPMAIKHDAIVAVRVKDVEPGKLELAHVTSSDPTSAHRAVTVDLKNINIDATTHAWSNYFLAGVKGVLNAGKVVEPVGMQMIASGTVPMGSGLSSSSALVVAASVATMHAQNVTMSKSEIAEMTRLAERFVGVEGGGMDQAISMLAERGSARLIRFQPLSSVPVTIPKDASFVVAHSMVQSNKYVTAATNYNMRVAECRFASLVLAKKLGLEHFTELTTLRAVQEKAGLSLQQMYDAVQQHLHDTPYTVAEVAGILDISVDKVSDTYLKTSAGTPMNTPDNYLSKLRALHVFSETIRVFEFEKACQKGHSGEVDDEETRKALGKLMDESQFSCRDLFDVSCPELETLTTLARTHGAYGSRLTGAGWGGCTVSLVHSDKVEEFIHALKQHYYSGFADTSNLLFASDPSAGASIYLPKA